MKTKAMQPVTPSALHLGMAVDKELQEMRRERQQLRSLLLAIERAVEMQPADERDTDVEAYVGLMDGILRQSDTAERAGHCLEALLQGVGAYR